MHNEKLYEEVGKYIEENYVKKSDDIKLDKEMYGIFEKISELRKKRKEKKANSDFEDNEFEVDESMEIQFDESTMKKTKITKTMSSSIASDRNIESLMGQIGETFSQRLLRLIDERGMSDSEVYHKAYVALELSIDEAKDLLNCAGFAFSKSSKMDIIIAYFLQNKIYDMFEINEILYEYGQPIFE